MSRSAFGGVAGFMFAATRRNPPSSRFREHRSPLNVIPLDPALLDQLPNYISERVSSCLPLKSVEKLGAPYGLMQ